MTERPDPLDALVAAGRTELDMLVRKAAMYDWLVAGGIYRLGYDNVGGPSLDRWDEVIPMLMQSCAGPNCTGHPHSEECRAEYARCLNGPENNDEQ
jgi:hypothetical protein